MNASWNTEQKAAYHAGAQRDCLRLVLVLDSNSIVGWCDAVDDRVGNRYGGRLQGVVVNQQKKTTEKYLFVLLGKVQALTIHP